MDIQEALQRSLKTAQAPSPSIIDPCRLFQSRTIRIGKNIYLPKKTIRRNLLTEVCGETTSAKRKKKV